MRSAPIEFYIYSCISEKTDDEWRLRELRGPIDKMRLTPLADTDEATFVLEDIRRLGPNCEVRIGQTIMVTASNGQEVEAHQFLLCNKASGKPLMVIDARPRSLIGGAE